MKTIALSVAFLVTFSTAAVVYAYSYCTFADGSGERVVCFPGDLRWGDMECESTCDMEVAQGGYCPDYVSTEYNACASRCFTDWGRDNCDDFCEPSMAHYCIAGERP